MQATEKRSKNFALLLSNISFFSPPLSQISLIFFIPDHKNIHSKILLQKTKFFLSFHNILNIFFLFTKFHLEHFSLAYYIEERF